MFGFIYFVLFAVVTLCDSYFRFVLSSDVQLLEAFVLFGSFLFLLLKGFVRSEAIGAEVQKRVALVYGGVLIWFHLL